MKILALVLIGVIGFVVAATTGFGWLYWACFILVIVASVQYRKWSHSH